jgi:TRAP-type C4-dicarboxylate transport system substrate-binding protein
LAIKRDQAQNCGQWLYAVGRNTRGGIVMSVKGVSSLISALLFAIVSFTGSSVALAQSRQFSFAYDQPKNSGYGAGAEMFNKKLMELSKGTLSINQYPGAQLGTDRKSTRLNSSHTLEKT